MAAKNLDDDLDLGIETGKGSKKKLVVLISAGVAFLLLSGLGAAWLLLGDDTNSDSASAQGQPPKEEKGEALYLPLEPLFIVNLPPDSRAKHLQVGIQVMAREQAVIDFVQHNDPMIRHSLLNLLGSQHDETLQSRTGKEKLQKELLKSMNKIVKNQGGSGEIEAVYFTTFVMQ